jgi:hypothetical protein
MSAGSRPFAAVRFARPTDRLDDELRFYEDGLGLNRIDSFERVLGLDRLVAEGVHRTGTTISRSKIRTAGAWCSAT